ncbi:hypothetical protein [Flavobacterium difficile]|uniref:Uncharacterized protein n=1 Tax=Flavobacterium difficile TaxID=2709659 RepID=A0ABX0I5H5_9FLAO|nr:hypothetical protein [Flavobacterium difficile]NHM02119.1 hypothetical protein [Flavobacterium difficile]
MEYKILNIFLSLLLLSYSIRTFYFTYKEPSTFSTDLKGYLFGISMSALCLMSLIGKFDLLETTITLFKDTFKVKTNLKVFVIIGWALFIMVGIAVYYYIKHNKNTAVKKVGFYKTKYLINTALIYLTILFLVFYLIFKILQ